MEEDSLQPTWNHALHVWVAFLWRNILFMIAGMVIGFIIGFVIGFIGGMLKVPMILTQVVIVCITLPIGLGLSIIPIKMLLDKKDFGSFRLVIRPNP